MNWHAFLFVIAIGAGLIGTCGALFLVAMIWTWAANRFGEWCGLCAALALITLAMATIFGLIA